MDSVKELFVELLGTFILVFAITATIAGSLAVTGSFEGINLVAIALAAGFVLTALIYSLSSFSGAHFNPAVTIGFWVAKRFSTEKALGYILAQLVGGILASGLIWLMTKGLQTGATTAGAFGLSGALVFETVATGLFVWVILSATNPKASTGHAGIAIGSFLAVMHLAGIAFSGASLNPARSIGPAFLTGGVAFSQLWIYLVGPVLGAVVAGLAFRFLMNGPE